MSIFVPGNCRIYREDTQVVQHTWNAAHIKCIEKIAFVEEKTIFTISKGQL